ncbi:MAG: DUF2721 domain-containing protein [Candidatus Thiodiazotropha sp. (ex Lucinoma annulata)]|nr:DUF2721 domain-containing protein [Candidatus Thiodiazotropha sp. (ex Lucinoma annulata)]
MMTEAIESWLTPLLFISAPALMILSTAARYAQLHGEIHHLQDHEVTKSHYDVCDAALLKRAIYFRNALVALYSAIALFATASLLGAVVSGWWDQTLHWVATMTVVGIGAVIFAAISLARESLLSLRIITLHFGRLDAD